VEAHLLSPWGQFGLLGLMAGAIVFLLYKIMMWTLAAHKELLKQMAETLKMYQSLSDSSTKAIERATESIKRHDEKAEERGRYVREEHKQMIETLGRINGYKDDH